MIFYVVNGPLTKPTLEGPPTPPAKETNEDDIPF